MDSLKSLLATLVDILRTRLDILTTELEEEKIRLGKLLLLAFAALFFLSLGLLFLSLLVIAAFWESHRLAVIGGLAGFSLGLGLVCGMLVRRRAKSKPGLFSTTLSELGKDRDRLTSRR